MIHIVCKGLAVLWLASLLASPPAQASSCYMYFSRSQYPSCSQLAPNVSLHWSVREGSITWALDLDGVWDWVGLGISEGGMLGADIAVAAHDLIAHRWTASDYWSTDFTFPQLDEHQDVSLVSIRKDSKAGVYGSTLVELRRPLVTCDPANQDRPILNDTRQTVIFAYGTGPFSYHGLQNRGETELVFNPNATAASGSGAAPSSLQTLDLRMTSGFVVPSAATTYQCVNLALPNETKYHIYRYEPLLDNTPLVHHFVAYSCPGSSPPATPVGVAYDCLQYMECEEFYMGWAPGLDGVDAPALAALPFGAGTNIRYLALQIHYTNVKGVTNQTDSSGFRILYSPVLKQYDMGVLTLGSYGIAVPPGAPSWSTAPNVCPGACTAKLAAGVNASGLTLVESFYHMHMLGRSMVTRHVRGGVELPPLGSREYFGFEYQTGVGIPPGARQLLPGDSLITTCTYTGKGRTNVTFFGPASNEEMCYNFLHYYPYNPVVSECTGMPELNATQCTTNAIFENLLNSMDNTTAAIQAGLREGYLVPLVSNMTYTPYQPTCVRTAPSTAGAAVDDDEQPSPHHRRNVGGAVAAILIVTFVGAVAVVVVYRAMRKKQQAEDEKHLFEKYNPSSLILPVAPGAMQPSLASPSLAPVGLAATGPPAVGSAAGAGGGTGLLGKGYAAVPGDVA